MASWSKDTVLEFIELYRAEESLWKVKSKEYSNRLIRERAYNKLIQFAKSVEPDADKEYVQKKINNLRGCFRKELKKVEGSRLSGAGADEIYQPKLWYYDNLLFLKDQETTRQTCSSMEADPNGYRQTQETEDSQDFEVKLACSVIYSSVEI